MLDAAIPQTSKLGDTTVTRLTQTRHSTYQARLVRVPFPERDPTTG